MIEKLVSCPLFRGIEASDIQMLIKCCGAKKVLYHKDQIIFHQHDVPRDLMILIDGSIVVCNDTVSGKRNIIATFEKSGELFGEVFVFLEKNAYDNYAQAQENSHVLHLPKSFFYSPCEKACDCHSKIISNMLLILAQKAYFLNQKVRILSYTTLRQKIASLFLNNCDENGIVKLEMNREKLADFLNVARPSLSRELMKMQSEGLIKVDKRQIIIHDFEYMQNIL